ncbi:hypothetical protein ON010_g7692 [Phytophthora cinnamomi]|nr:hypothetical protein ON010_g7692 [Phytophthora cinnamomi]
MDDGARALLRATESKGFSARSVTAPGLSGVPARRLGGTCPWRVRRVPCPSRADLSLGATCQHPTSYASRVLTADIIQSAQGLTGQCTLVLDLENSALENYRIRPHVVTPDRSDFETPSYSAGITVAAHNLRQHIALTLRHLVCTMIALNVQHLTALTLKRLRLSSLLPSEVGVGSHTGHRILGGTSPHVTGGSRSRSGQVQFSPDPP